MTDDLEELKGRLVVGHKRDGRSVYDEAAKSELVARCLQPGVSVARLARECGGNANQVSRWLREHGQGRRRRLAVTSPTPTPAAFMAVSVVAAPTPEDGPAERGEHRDGEPATMSLQARLTIGQARPSTIFEMNVSQSMFSSLRQCSQELCSIDARANVSSSGGWKMPPREDALVQQGEMLWTRMLWRPTGRGSFSRVTNRYSRVPSWTIASIAYAGEPWCKATCPGVFWRWICNAEAVEQ